MNADKRPTPSPEKIAQLAGFIKLFGAVLVLAGVAVWFDAGALASGIGLEDIQRKMLSAVFVVMGLTEFFVIPKLVLRSIKSDKQGD